MSVRNHLFAAALIWSVAGILLVRFGINGLFGAGLIWPVIAAILAGTVKSLFVLDKAAGENVGRIRRFAKSTCVLKVYSARMWLFIGLMAGFGRLLRTSSLPPTVTGVIFTAIGWSLFFSSRMIWQAWRTDG
ncbi:MAG: hypothetical protein KAI90_04850 [Desulfobulbaceae bacterium]|nr:hypothetical protein [Desulfobulbaceae bacterium]MCK5544849.1 hypothetical protein [Desulfobulbaceae bacterium]